MDKILIYAGFLLQLGVRLAHHIFLPRLVPFYRIFGSSAVGREHSGED